MNQSGLCLQKSSHIMSLFAVFFSLSFSKRVKFWHRSIHHLFLKIFQYFLLASSNKKYIKCPTYSTLSKMLLRGTFPKKQTEILTDSLNRYMKQARHYQVRPSTPPKSLTDPQHCAFPNSSSCPCAVVHALQEGECRLCCSSGDQARHTVLWEVY